MTLEEIRRVAIYEMGFNPRKDDNVDLLARFAIAVLDALGEERTYARQIWEADRGLVNALEWAGRLSAIDGVRASIVRRLRGSRIRPRVIYSGSNVREPESPSALEARSERKPVR